MSLSRTCAIIRKEFLHILRDGWTLFMVTLAPAFMLVTLTYVLSFDVQQVAVGVMDQDHTPQSRYYVTKITNQRNISLYSVLRSYPDLDEHLLRGEIEAALVVPPGFGRALQRGEPAQIQVVLDGTDPSVAREALAALNRPELQAPEETQALSIRQGTVPLELRRRVWFNPDLRVLFSTVPGLVGVVLCMPAMAMAMALAREREHHTLEGLVATSVRPAELMVGKLVPYLVAGLVGCVFATLAATLWFHVPFRGQYLGYALLMADFLLAILAMSLLLSAFAGSQQAATIGVFLAFFLPSFFLSGLIQAPPVGRSLSWVASHLLPTTYAVAICRAVFLKGAPWVTLWPQALALAGLGVGSFLVCVTLFRWRLG